MSQTNDTCRNCRLPRAPNHSFAGFDTDGTPTIECGRDPKLGADLVLEAVNRLWADNDADPILDGIRKLWNGGDHSVASALLMSVDQVMTRLETVAANVSATGRDLDRKTEDHKEALVRLADMELSGKQQKAKIARLENELTQLKAETAVAVSDAVQATKAEMQEKLDEAMSAADQLEKDWKARLADCHEQASFKDKRLAEIEANVAALRKDKDDLTAALIAANARADLADADAEKAEAQIAPLEEAHRLLQTKALRQAKANLELNDKIGELKDRVDELAKVCKDQGNPVSEIVLEVVTEPVDPKEILDEKEVVRLERPVKRSVAAKEVPPPPPAASADTAPVGFSPLPDANLTVPAPVAAVQTDVCICCGKPAAKVAKDKWQTKDGSFVDPVFSCKRLATHVDAIFQVLDGIRDQLVNPPSDSSDILSEFEDITSTSN